MRDPVNPAPPVFPAIEELVAGQAARNRCASGPVVSDVNGDVTRRAYAGCAGGADVVLYTVHGGGHTWPGGEPLPEWFAGATSSSIDATAELWAFFREHPLAR
jgi:polyhydroxybutyrate depolymerase